MIQFKKLPFKIENTWITGCLHYNHLNICRGTSRWSDIENTRKFSSLEDMNSALVKGINDNVEENDLIIELGDFSFQGKFSISKFREQIVCRNIIKTWGNHCQHISMDNTYMREGVETNCWLEINHLAYFQIESIKLVASHYPIFNWHEQNRGTIMVHSHLHGNECKNLKEYHDNYKIVDCGIDEAFRRFGTYRPFNLSEIIEITKDKNKLDRH